MMIRTLLISSLIIATTPALAGDPNTPAGETCGAQNGTTPVPAATFWLGNLHPDCDCPAGFQPKPDAQASTPDLCIDTHEVTVAQYQACVDAGACTPLSHTTAFPGAAFTADAACNREGDAPVNCVDATQAQSYCAFRGGRLPTEAEWEHAASGDFGLQQTGTSLWEWTATPYAEDHPAAYIPELSQGVPDDARVTRGGFADLGHGLTTPRELNRAPVSPDVRHPTVGFRCTR